MQIDVNASQDGKFFYFVEFSGLCGEYKLYFNAGPPLLQ